jgi:type III secretion protein W
MAGDPSISHSAQINQQSIQQLQQAAEEEEIVVVDSEDFAGDADFSGMIRIMGQFKELDKLKTQAPVKSDEKSATEEKKVLDVAAINETAGRYRKNSEDELNERTLLSLLDSLKEGDTPDEITSKAFRVYADHALADDALAFLSETTEGQLQENVKVAKDKFNQDFKREIAAGHNMSAQAREFAKEGLGSPTALRDLYRDIILNQREPLVLFEEFTEKFRYDKLKTVVAFLLSSLGADLKSKGPSIAHAELKKLVDEVRSLQGILGVFKFFQGRMSLILSQFGYYNLVFPSRITFEALGRMFAKILAERFMSADKILQVFQVMGLSEEAAAQLIICTQFRDALRQISPRYYRTPQHRDELFKTILDALEKIEDQMDEEEE